MPRYRIRNFYTAALGFYEDPAPAIEGVDGAILPVHIKPAETKIVNISGAQERDAKLHEGARHITMELVGDDEVDEAPTAPEKTAAPTAPVAPPYLRDEFDEMTDEALRAFITTRDGRSPHPATGRIKLLNNARNPPKGDEHAEDTDTNTAAAEAV